ncbi:MAG TPA: hypothetical protein VNG33_05730, partial [Polyangiaceae bacterium]|nr:hypothetical protein [Polyangiaceae bacterium]
VAYRGHSDGFYVAESGARITLFQVSPDGSSKNLGSYPVEPSGIYAYQNLGDAALTKDGVLYEIGNRTSNNQKVIMRRAIGGTSEIIYDEADDPYVQITGFGRLLTSP